MKVLELLKSTAEKFECKTAITDDQSSVTYRELFDKIDSIARELTTSGIKHGDGVGVIGKNSIGFIASVLGAAQAGAVVMPISSMLRKSEFESLLIDAPLHALIDDGSANFKIENQLSKISMHSVPKFTLNLFRSDDKSFIDFIDDPVFIRFSSGTTGKSKGVVLSNKSVIERIEAANSGLCLSDKDNVIWILQMAFHFFVSIILYLSVGATIILTPDNLAETLIDYTNKYNGTFLYASPLHIRMLASDESGKSFTSLRKVISTSTGIDKANCEKFHERFGIPVCQALGIIEIGLPLINTNQKPEKSESVGKALLAYTVEILDEKLNILPQGLPGQLAIKGPGFFEAYLNPPQKASDILKNGWFLTGDTAIKDNDGYITIIGRSKAVINVGGNKVFPDEVEEVLNTIPDIAGSRVSARPHKMLGEIVHADVIPKYPRKIPDKEEIISYCRKKLSSYKTPQSIEFVDEIKTTASGKIIR